MSSIHLGSYNETTSKQEVKTLLENLFAKFDLKAPDPNSSENGNDGYTVVSTTESIQVFLQRAMQACHDKFQTTLKTEVDLEEMKIKYFEIVTKTVAVFRDLCWSKGNIRKVDSAVEKLELGLNNKWQSIKSQHEDDVQKFENYVTNYHRAYPEALKSVLISHFEAESSKSFNDILDQANDRTAAALKDQVNFPSKFLINYRKNSRDALLEVNNKARCVYNLASKFKDEIEMKLNIFVCLSDAEFNKHITQSQIDAITAFTHKDPEFRSTLRIIISGIARLMTQQNVDVRTCESNVVLHALECTKDCYRSKMQAFCGNRILTSKVIHDFHSKLSNASIVYFEQACASFHLVSGIDVQQYIVQLRSALNHLMESFVIENSLKISSIKSNASSNAKAEYIRKIKVALIGRTMSDKELKQCHEDTLKQVLTVYKLDIKEVMHNCDEEIQILREYLSHTAFVELKANESKEHLVIDLNKNFMNAKGNAVIGIDLGDERSCVAVCRNGMVHVIPNNDGKNKTWNYVSFTDTCELVGDPAKDQAHTNPENTVSDLRFLIGRDFKDRDLQEKIKSSTFSIAEEAGLPKIQTHGRKYDPEHVLSYVLKELKKMAENFLKCEVKNTVITVPVYFTERQKQATIDAATLAELNVLKIIEEPIAAWVGYELYKKSDSRSRNILIFHLSTASLDVAILNFKDEIINVKAVDRSTHLGGEEFTKNIAHYCIEQHETKTGVNLLAGLDSTNVIGHQKTVRTLRRLKNECEKQKCFLSSMPMVEIQVDAIDRNMDLSVTLTREKFEKLNQKLFDEALAIVKKLLKESRTGKQEIDDIYLVGGSTRIPKFQQMLSEYFDGKCTRISQVSNPEEVIAIGAAVFAAIENTETAQT